MDNVGRDWVKSLARIDVCDDVGLGHATVASKLHKAKQSRSPQRHIIQISPSLYTILQVFLDS